MIYNLDKSTSLFISIASYASLIYSLVLICIWLFIPHPELLTLFKLAVPPFPNTAICLSVLSLSLILHHGNKYALSLFGCSFVYLICLLTFIEYSFEVDLTIDNFFIKAPPMPSTTYPGRMFPNTLICITLMSLCIGSLSLARSNYIYCLLNIITALIALILAVLAILGFIIGLPINSIWGLSTSMSLYTALCVLILANGIVATNFYYGLNSKKNMKYWIPFFGAFIVFFATLLLWQALTILEERSFQQILSTQVTSTKTLVHSSFIERIEAIARMTERWVHRERTPKHEWLSDASAYLRDLPGYTALAWSDEHLKIRWVTPESALNLSILGTSLAKNKRRLNAIETAIEQKRIILSRSVKLLSGAEGIIVYSPIFKNSTFVGIISAGFDTQKLFNSILEKTNREQFNTIIRDGNNTIYSTDVPQNQYLKYAESDYLNLYGTNLEIEIVPKKAFIAQNTSWIPTLVLSAGLLFSGLFYFILYLMQISRKNLEIATQAKEESELTNSLLNGIIESTKDLVAAINRQYKFINFNTAYEKEVQKHLKIQVQLGEDVRDALIKTGYEHQIDLWRRALEGEAITHIEEIKDDTGQSYFFELSFSSICNEKGESLGASHIVKNITHHIRAERALIASKELLQTDLAVVEKKHLEVSLLNEMSTELQTCVSYKQIGAILGKYSKQLLGVTNGLYYIKNEITKKLELVYSWGSITDNRVISLLDSDCFGISSKQAYYLTPNNTQSNCKHRVANSSRDSICFPLLNQGKNIGLLYFEQEEVDKSQLSLFKAVTEQTGLVLANLKLRKALSELSIRDPLTDLFNRRYLEGVLQRELYRAKRDNSQIGIILMDADKFKNLNDTYGHDTGDYVLLQLTKLFLAYTRKSDLVCRYGGEEFILCAFNISKEKILELAERIRLGVEKTILWHNNQNIPNVTLSLGVAMYPTDGQTISSLIKSADLALYNAKQKGRNRTVFYQDI